MKITKYREWILKHFQRGMNTNGSEEQMNAYGVIKNNERRRIDRAIENQIDDRVYGKED